MKELEELRKAVNEYDNGELGYKAVVNAARAASLVIPEGPLVPADEYASLKADYTTVRANRDHYRGLVVRVGNMIGKPARTADDGSTSDEVLCDKVPGLVLDILLRRENAAAKAAAHSLHFYTER
jgi:hypothetical protein